MVTVGKELSTRLDTGYFSGCDLVLTLVGGVSTLYAVMSLMHGLVRSEPDKPDEPDLATLGLLWARFTPMCRFESMYSVMR